MTTKINGFCQGKETEGNSLPNVFDDAIAEAKKLYTTNTVSRIRTRLDSSELQKLQKLAHIEEKDMKELQKDWLKDAVKCSKALSHVSGALKLIKYL